MVTFARYCCPMGAPHDTEETIDGSIERVTFHNPDNGFADQVSPSRGWRLSALCEINLDL